MKQSKYNYIVEKNDLIFCFNSLSFHYFKINKDKKELLEKFLSDSEKYKSTFPSFYHKMVEGAYLVDDNVDELDIIRNRNQEAQNSKTCMLVILPTYDCNFNCWYCIQKHQKNSMNKNTIEKVKAYIKRIVSSAKIDCLYIDWFGGEPFLYYHEVIEPILTYAQTICREKAVGYFTCATTNGYLITGDIANKLKDFNFKNLYITLDGDKEHHDTNRIALKGSSYDTILNNVNELCKINKDINITLRINYDETNFDPDLLFKQVNSIIDKSNQPQITFTLRKIWQVNKKAKNRDLLIRFISIIKTTSYKFDFSGDLNTNFLPCYAAQKNMKLITPNGMVGKCSAKEDFETTPLGEISDEGILKWKQNLPIDEFYAKPLFENERCLSCKHLPICMGPCPNNLDPNNPNQTHYGCKGRLNDLSFNDAILNYCEFSELLTQI